MPRYRTEIVVAADRYVCLQLPPDFPEGPAVVTVHVPDPSGSGTTDVAEDMEGDRDDIEWWDEFEGDRGSVG